MAVWAAAGGAALGALAGGLSTLFKNRGEARAAKIRRDLANDLRDNYGILDPESLIVSFENLPGVQNWTPQTWEAVLQNPSMLEGYADDPRLVDSIYGALGKFEELATQGGFDDADRGNLQAEQMGIAAQERSQRGAIIQQADARGLGREATLAGQLAAQQGAANNYSMQSNRIAQEARARALSALESQAGLADREAGRQFTQAQGIASATDAVNANNARFLNDAGKFNAEAVSQSRRDRFDEDSRQRQQAIDVRTGNADRHLDGARHDLSRGVAAANIEAPNAQGEVNKGENTGKYLEGLGAGGMDLSTKIMGS